MKTVTAQIKPIVTEIVISQDRLQLDDEEMSDLSALKEYVQLYYVPEGFEVTSILVSNN